MSRTLAPERAKQLAAYRKKHPYPCSCAIHFDPHGPYEKSEEFKSYRDTGPVGVFDDGKVNHHGCILWRGPAGKKNGEDALFLWYDPAIRRAIPITIARYTYLVEHGADSLQPGEHVVAWCGNPRCCNPDHVIPRRGSSVRGAVTLQRKQTKAAFRSRRVS